MSFGKTVLVIVSILQASLAKAEEAWHTEILEIAQTFSDLAEEQQVIDYSLMHMHQQVLSALANQMGLTNEAAMQRMRAGYASSSTIIELVSHDIFVENAQFGDAENHRWGAVPYSSEMIYRENRSELPRTCSWLLVFEDGGRWFFNSAHSGSARTRALLASGLPEPVSAVVGELNTPLCKIVRGHD